MTLSAGALFALDPALAADAPPPLSAYGELPGVEQMSLSPNGTAIAAATRINGERRFIVIDPAGGVRAMLPLGDAKIRGVDWVDEQHVSLVRSATEYIGDEFTKSTMELSGAIIIPLDGSKPWLVFGNIDSMAHATFGSYGFRTIGGHAFGYFGGLTLARTGDGNGYRFDRGDPALFAVNMENKSVHRLALAAADGHYRDWVIDGAGKVAATLDYSRGDGNWTLLAGTGAAIARGNDPSARVSLISLSHDGSAAILRKRDPDGNEPRWYQVPLAGGAPTEFLGGVDVERIYVDPASGRMIGYLPDSGESSGVPVLDDPALQERMRKVYRAFPKRRVEVRDFTQDMSRVLVRTSGNGDPGSWFLVDVTGRKADPVGDERPLIGAAQVGPISTVTYHAADGLELRGILTLPPGRDPHNLPVVMLPHGGPNARDVAAFDWWAQALASRGYAVFQPNFRGSTDRDDAFIHAGDGQWGRKMQTDISDGLAELARQGIVDPKRACIVGASYGGYAALAGVTLQKGLYRCAVAVAPVSDLSEMYYTDLAESADDPLTRRLQKQQLGDPSTFGAVSPRRHAAQADAPVLLIHGKDDTVVPFRQSQTMADALKDAHKPVEMVVLQKEDHWLSRSETRKQMLEA
ncbi:MAG: S9 family peptidase [Sphingomonadales bacterium]|nr:S9 family peptidase [Sphingomonadales bacterium]